MPDLSRLSRSVEGLTVLVTGAASGMGAVTAKLFAAEGAQVIATDVNEAGLKSVVDEIQAAGKSARGWRMDVRNGDEILRVVGEGAEAFGGLDIIINNAGISAFAPIDHESYEEVWERCVAVLLTSHQRIIRAGLPYLRKSSAPRIVNIASTEALGATATDRCHRFDARPCCRAWQGGDHGELHLPRPDRDRYDGGHLRRAQGHICASPHCATSLWRA